MRRVPLRLGPLRAEGYRVFRSGARWLCESGQYVRAGEPIVYFNLTLRPGTRSRATLPFADERVLQVACAARSSGRLQRNDASSRGGYLSIQGFDEWDADETIGHLDLDDTTGDDADERLRLLLLAARRMTPLVDVHPGLLPGWHSRSRGWWTDGAPPVTLLSLGICDVTGPIAGERGAFIEFFAAEDAPTQIVFVPDHPITPMAPVVLDQLERTPAQFREIAADLHASLSAAGVTPTANDWMFAGTTLGMMERSPIHESYEVLSGDGLIRRGPPDAVLVSLAAEFPSVLEHKALGYRLHSMSHHLEAAGPAVRAWMTKAFTPVERTIDTIKADYERLFDAIARATGARVLVINRMSTSGEEDITTYAPFDAPLSRTLANVAAKELNLMLEDVAAERNVSIIDVDALGAEIGGGEHLPDGIHQSRLMQELVRVEICAALNELRATEVHDDATSVEFAG